MHGGGEEDGGAVLVTVIVPGSGSLEYPDPSKSREGRTEGGKISGHVKAGLYGCKPVRLTTKEVTYLDIGQ